MVYFGRILDDPDVRALLAGIPEFGDSRSAVGQQALLVDGIDPGPRNHARSVAGADLVLVGIDERIERMAVLPRLPREKDGPVFGEPWEAQAFDLAIKLSDQGHFTWKEWAEALGRELREAAERGEPDDDGSHYYHHWLAALERLVAAKGLTDRTALEARKEAWAEAYRHTAHGKPVELLIAADSADHEHT